MSRPEVARDAQTAVDMGEEEVARRSLRGPLKVFAMAWGVVMVLYHLYALLLYPADPMILRAMHLGFVCVLAFLTYPAGARAPRDRATVLDVVLCLASVGIVAYLLVTRDELIYRIGISPNTADVVVGSVTVALVLELTRRVMGWQMPGIALAFLAYGIWGHHLPGILGFRQVSFDRLISLLYSEQGIFGVTLQASATLALLFITFGAFLDKSGAGDFFVKAAYALTGFLRGGPAKTAIVASGLLGMMSGNAVSNVVTTGTFTIPLMKRTGYRPVFAATVEAVSSVGGQLMPPVMGTAAFILAELAGVPYSTVMVAAFLPALLYYVGVFFMADFEALRLGLRGIPRAELPSLGRALRERGYLLLPVAVLIYLMAVADTSPFKAVLWSTVVLILVSWVRRETALTPARTVGALYGGARGVITVAAACATAGIVIGVLTITGLGLRFSSLIIAAAGGYLPLVLILTMVVALILGLGLPTAPSYILTAAVAVPILARMDVPLLSAHLFVLYFACLSTITPPVAVSAFAAAGIAGADPSRVGWLSVKMGFAGYLVPFFVVYSPALLLVGQPWTRVLLALVTSLVGTYAMARSLHYPATHWIERVMWAVGAVLLIDPDPLTDLLGIACLGGAYAVRRFMSRPAGRCADPTM